MNVTYNCPACHKPAREQLVRRRRDARLPALPPADRHPGQRNRGRPASTAASSARAPTCSPARISRSGWAWRWSSSASSAAASPGPIIRCFWTFAILFVTALVDLVLYIVMGESLTCYRCHAQYRGFEEIELHGGFDLETHERYRQMAARMKEQPIDAAADMTECSCINADCGLRISDCAIDNSSSRLSAFRNP